MKIGFDLHGVLNDLPQVFQFIMSSVIDNGAEVHIITGSTTEKALKELDELGYVEGVHYTHVVGLPDYLEEIGCKAVGVHPTLKNKEFSKFDWDSAKGIYCRVHQIDLHFDDTIEYGDYFVSPFARVWTKNK